MRIVSLLPSATEIVCALGLKENLVGRSHECDFPPGLANLPVCTAPKFPGEGGSAAIDQGINNLVARGLSVYEVKTPLLASLRPDVIVTQSQCEVCAVSSNEVHRAVRDLLGPATQVIDLQPVDYSSVFQDIRRAGAGLQRKAEAEAVVKEMEDRIDRVFRRVRDQPIVSVATIEWLEPLMNAGNWMPDLIARAGGRDVFADKGLRSHYIEWSEVREADPEVLLLLPCGFGIERTLSEIDLLTHRPGWSELRAVQHRRVFVTDGNQYFNRPGPRLADSVEIVGEVLHPAVMGREHQGKGWVRL